MNPIYFSIVSVDHCSTMLHNSWILLNTLEFFQFSFRFFQIMYIEEKIIDSSFCYIVTFYRMKLNSKYSLVSCGFLEARVISGGIFCCVWKVRHAQYALLIIIIEYPSAVYVSKIKYKIFNTIAKYYLKC